MALLRIVTVTMLCEKWSSVASMRQVERLYQYHSAVPQSILDVIKLHTNSICCLLLTGLADIVFLCDSKIENFLMSS